MRRSIVRSAALLGAAALVLAAVVAMTTESSAAKGDPRLYNLRKKVLGKSAGEWTAEWWQWAFSIPLSVNPFFDDTGEFAEVGQRGPVWFLAGNIGASANVERTATIPAGRPILVGVVNVMWDYLDPTTQTPEAIRAGAASFIGAVDFAKTSCEVDGVPISGLADMRVVSPFFEYTTPDDGVYSGTGQNFPGGIYRPAISDGYWVFLKPLRPGEHTIHWTSHVGGSYNFGGDTIYHLTVVDHDRP